MSNVRIFLRGGEIDRAIVTGAPADDEDKFSLLDSLGAFMEGHAKILVESPDHPIEVVR